MPITKDEILTVKAPFKVRDDRRKKARPITVAGFSKNDPLGVGGGIFPDMPTAYFEDGGWLLAADLMKHYSIVR